MNKLVFLSVLVLAVLLLVVAPSTAQAGHCGCDYGYSIGTGGGYSNYSYYSRSYRPYYYYSPYNRTYDHHHLPRLSIGFGFGHHGRHYSGGHGGHHYGGGHHGGGHH